VVAAPPDAVNPPAPPLAGTQVLVAVHGMTGWLVTPSSPAPALQALTKATTDVAKIRVLRFMSAPK
jgi:hypothetical protein